MALHVVGCMPSIRRRRTRDWKQYCELQTTNRSTWNGVWNVFIEDFVQDLYYCKEVILFLEEITSHN